MFLTPTGSDVVLFVFEPGKVDDLPSPWRVNSLTFRLLESLFLHTFAVYCDFSIDYDNFCLNCSFEKSVIFQGKFARTKADFRRNSFSLLLHSTVHKERTNRLSTIDIPNEFTNRNTNRKHNFGTV